MKAHKEAGDVTTEQPSAAPISVYYNVINSQVAGGDITNSTTFVGILAKIEVALDGLHEVEPEVREEAKGLVMRLLGSAAVGGDVAADAAGALISALLAKYLHIPPG